MLGLLIVLTGCGSFAIGYGHWLSTDRLSWSGPADCVVTLSGTRQIPQAVTWLTQGAVREIWIPRALDDPLVSMGIYEHLADTTLREFHAAGVPDSVIRVLAINAQETNVPRLLQEIGQAAEDHGARQVIVECHTLEPRFLRQIADAALPSQQAERLRFVSLPDENYTAMCWWTCRAAWKDVYQISLEILTNFATGPLSGFETPHWDPDAWEAQTFPQNRRARP